MAKFLPTREDSKPQSYKPIREEKKEIPDEFKANAPVNKVENEIDENTKKKYFDYLRTERNKLLALTDYVNTGVQTLTLEKRAALYRYRDQLRDLPAMDGAPWTPESIPWPTRPDV